MRTASDELSLGALDPCGQLLWQRPVASEIPERELVARLVSDNEVVLDALRNYGDAQQLWHFDLSGEPLSQQVTDPGAGGWIAGTRDGLFINTYEQPNRYVTRIAPDGSEARIEPVEVARRQRIPASEEECAAFGSVLGCYSASYDTGSLEALWTTSSLELPDGTTRHLVNPASDGDTLYTIVYGVSSYHAVARSMRSGEMRWRHALGPSPSGQNGLRTGGPVIGEGGLVHFYIAYMKLAETRLIGDVLEEVTPAVRYGWVISYDNSGAERWRLDVAEENSWSVYDEHAMLVAGRGDILYFGGQRVVMALDGQTGATLWRRDDLGLSFTPRVALSPNGDLLVQTRDERLHLLATESAGGAADSPWPAPGGDRRNLNAR